MKTNCKLVSAIAFFSFAVYAGGPADKVTGEYVLNDTFHRLVSAHEAIGRHPQKGFFLSWGDGGAWYELDFNDTENTCVNVFSDGQARFGGLVGAGSEGLPQIGRYFGFIVVDGGEPGAIADHGYTYRVSTDYWSESARLALLNWCDTGVIDETRNGFIVWGPHLVTEGNLQVHYTPGDTD